MVASSLSNSVHAFGLNALPSDLSMEAYFQEFSFLQTSVALQTPLVSEKTLRKWARTFVQKRFSLVLPTPIARQGFSQEELERINLLVEALEPSSLVLACDKALAPSQVNRDVVGQTITALEESFPKIGKVWVPGSLWEEKAVLDIACSFPNIATQINPLANVLEGESPSLLSGIPKNRGYFFVSNIGSPSRKFSELDVEALCTLRDLFEETSIVFDARSCLRLARLFKRLTESK